MKRREDQRSYKGGEKVRKRRKKGKRAAGTMWGDTRRTIALSAQKKQIHAKEDAEPRKTWCRS